MRKGRSIPVIICLSLCVLLMAAIGEPAVVAVDCGLASLQAAVNSAAGGTVISVSGTCNENITISQSKNLITIDGGGTAAIQGANASKNSIDIKGRGIVIKRLTISGGIDGIYVNRGGTATIDSNTIENTGRHGIAISQNSHADIIRNTIQNNPLDGIHVDESSSARIGFLTYQDTASKPNAIKLNGRNGIVVARSSSAVIVGNWIVSNTNNGVAVVRASHADVSKNTINGNKQNGIYVDGNSGVNLGNLEGTTIFDLPNATTVNNSQYGLSCSNGGFVVGRIGTLNGVSSDGWDDDTCHGNVQP